MAAILWTTLATLTGLVAVVFLGIPYLESALLYQPDRHYVTPAEAGLSGVAERLIASPDGPSVIAWQVEAQPGAPTILYFHGNGGSLGTRAERLRKYAAQGFGMLMMTYRGYGGSGGSPSERANVADALRAYDLLVTGGVRSQDIIVYGESLGSGIAVQVAAARPVGGVILDAPYTSLADVAERVYPYLLPQLLMRDRYETKRFIGKVTAPVLVIHGEQDELIPVTMGKAIAKAAGGPAEFAAIPGAGHNDHYLFGSYDIIAGWIGRLRAGRLPQTPARHAG